MKCIPRNVKWIRYSSLCTTDYIEDDVIKKLCDRLPHGSGIDYSWELARRGTRVWATNTYHGMNEVGMYDGTADFICKFRWDKQTDTFFLCSLHFIDCTQRHKSWFYGLDDCLWQTICDGAFCNRDERQFGNGIEAL